jgi:hypothetical protein
MEEVQCLPLHGTQGVLVSVDHMVKFIPVEQTDTSHVYTGMFSLDGGTKVSKGSTVVLHTDIDIRHLNSSIGGPLTLMKSQHDLPHRLLRPELLILRMGWISPMLFYFTTG